MIYKEWPNTVWLKQEGRYWFIVRRVRWRNRVVDDVLEVTVDRQSLVALLIGRGYCEADSVVESVWLRSDLSTPCDPPRVPEHLASRTPRGTEHQRRSDGSKILVR
jgi:hypothetical protein